MKVAETIGEPIEETARNLARAVSSGTGVVLVRNAPGPDAITPNEQRRVRPDPGQNRTAGKAARPDNLATRAATTGVNPHRLYRNST